MAYSSSSSSSSTQSTLFWLLPLLTILLLLPLPAHSLTCTTQKFPQNKLFAHCLDLPTLDAYLHWTYDAAKSTLSVAFIAPPAKPDGWISWAINPIGTGMAGSQALVAFNQPKGGVALKTYNITSYASVVESELSFPVTDKKAEISDGVITIFATLGLPDNKTSVNHIWQVGSSVTGGKPDKHDFKAANLGAKGTVDLVAGSNGTSSVPVAPVKPATPPKSGGGESAPSKAGAAGINSKFGVYSMMAIFGSFLLL